MKYLTLKEIQQEETSILKAVIEFFDKNNLKYSIFGGTLLGAVRHNGFIPWDDDIDLAMPRNEYIRLIYILKENRCELNDKLKAVGFELENGVYPFIKIINLDYHVEDNFNLDKYLWVDIFPIDGFPEKYKFFERKRNLLLKIMKFKWVFKYGKNNLAKSVKNNIKLIISRFINEKKITQRYINYCSKFPIENCKNVNDNIWGFGAHTRISKDLIEEYQNYQFETINVKGWVKYDYILSHRYENYMEIPSKNKRITHNIKVWKL